MVDLVQLQEDVTYLLAGAEALEPVSVRSYRKMRMQNELDARKVLVNERSGRSGSGILVILPLGDSRNPNVSGPVLDWLLPVVCVEQPAISMEPTIGTLLSAEELAQHVMNVAHLHADESYGTLVVQGRAVEPEKEFLAMFPGCVAYRVTFRLSAGKSIQTQRVGPVIISVAAGSATLSCGTASAEIRYTTDGTFPAVGAAGNPASFVYTAPFAVQAGAVIRAAAYKAALNPSAVRRHAVT